MALTPDCPRGIHQRETQHQTVPGDERDREREKYYTYPALRLIQVLPGHPLADYIRLQITSLEHMLAA